MIESSDSCSLLGHDPRSTRQSTRGGYARDEPSPRNVTFHRAPRQEILHLAVGRLT
jgi:hypothetical protein